MNVPNALGKHECYPYCLSIWIDCDQYISFIGFMQDLLTTITLLPHVVRLYKWCPMIPLLICQIADTLNPRI